MNAERLGEMIQLDHIAEGIFKHFAAICPISKLVFARAYRQATAATSVDFLEKMILFFLFTLTSIQVDGGSEFMAEFEVACKKAQYTIICTSASITKAKWLRRALKWHISL